MTTMLYKGCEYRRSFEFVGEHGSVNEHLTLWQDDQDAPWSYRISDVDGSLFKGGFETEADAHTTGVAFMRARAAIRIERQALTDILNRQTLESQS